MISMERASAAWRCRSALAKRGLLALAAFAAMLGTLTVEAQTNLKIGFVQFERLMQEAPQLMAVQEKLKDEFAARQRDLLAAGEKLKGQQDTYTRDAPVMGEAERANLEREIREGTRDLQRAQNELQEDFNLRRNEEVQKLQQDILRQIQAYASAQKYDLVVADALYVSNAIDITAAVIEALKSAPAPRATAPPRPSGP
jgi:outer membrane protein